MSKQRHPQTGATKARSKMPINPSVRGTAEQADREGRGDGQPNFREEGSEDSGSSGRGGKYR